MSDRQVLATWPHSTPLRNKRRGRQAVPNSGHTATQLHGHSLMWPRGQMGTARMAWKSWSLIDEQG
jgi:hypothetical protein